MSKLLLEERPLVILPKLAVKIGLNEAIFIQQIHYLLTISTTSHNSMKWTYNTYEELQDMFPFWSARTIKTVVKSLKETGLLFVEQLSTDKRNKTNYYSINYTKLDELELSCTDHSAEVAPSEKQGFKDDKSCTMHSAESGVLHSAKVAQCIIDTKTSTKTSSNISKKTNKKETYTLPASVDTELFEDYLELRKTLKAPNTQRAINGLINKLIKFQEKGYDINEIISTAYENGWKSFYEPKPQFNNRANNTNIDFALRNNVFDVIESLPTNTQGMING